MKYSAEAHCIVLALIFVCGALLQPPTVASPLLWVAALLVTALVPLAASGIETEGHDPAEGHGAEHESPARKGTPK